MTLRWVVTQKNVKNQLVTKAQLVAHGFQETQDFRKDSSACSRVCLQLTLAIKASMSWKLKSLDIETAFPQGQTRDRTIHVLPPPEAETQALWKLRKCIYGLSDAPQCFYMHLREVLSELNVYPNSLDEGLFFADNQSTVDAIHSSSLILDRRLRVEMSALCQYQASLQIDFQHVKGTHQLSDAPTKRGASNKFLLATLQQGVLP